MVRTPYNLTLLYERPRHNNDCATVPVQSSDVTGFLSLVRTLCDHVFAGKVIHHRQGLVNA